ncbi:RNA polymerase sigma factor [Brevundimonas sp.]|uniref:RNA polymerase sigma factor n=1 Tax=Brevundimonas sp. TaxID=1871086 RepID=UPI001ACB44F4|nr:RNA polymerase sigma factor [Brevundimonas sp.]MBN9466298.1 RNA polymerase sigma factor [Brevundimonas sp.]
MTQAQASVPTEEARALDRYLVVSAQGGDRSALDLLARRWDRRLRAHAWRVIGDVDLAGEATQAAWLDIAHGLSGLRDESAFAAWAFRIVTRRCAGLIRQRRRQRGLVEAVGAEMALDPLEVSISDPVAPRLQAAIRGLPHAQRAAVALFYFEDLSIAEIAVALDVPAGTVKTRLMHARRVLRAVLEGDQDERDR